MIFSLTHPKAFGTFYLFIPSESGPFTGSLIFSWFSFGKQLSPEGRSWRVYSVSFLVLQGTRSIIKNSHILLSFNYSTLHPNSTINFYNNISIRIHTFKEGFCFLLRSKFYCKKNVFFEEILNFLIVKDNKSFLFKKGIEQLYILDACLLLRGRGK